MTSIQKKLETLKINQVKEIASTLWSDKNKTTEKMIVYRQCMIVLENKMSESEFNHFLDLL